MSSDVSFAFSRGALSEREPGAPNVRIGLSRSESVSFTARKVWGATGEWATLEEPRCVEVARFPNQEMAQSYAVALSEWWALRPTEVSPFFDSVVRVEPSFEGLLGIFERMLRPESSYWPVSE